MIHILSEFEFSKEVWNFAEDVLNMKLGLYVLSLIEEMENGSMMLEV